MYTIEVHSRVNEILRIFDRVGLWRNEDGSTVIRKTGWKLCYLIFQVIYVVSMILGGLSSDDKNEFVFLIAGGIAAFVVSVKLYYILWKKDEIRAFILEIGTHSVSDHEEFVKINDKMKNLMKFSSSYILMTIGIVSALIIFRLPVFTSQKMLPVNVWFPFDWKNNSIIYWIAYGFVSTGLIISFIGSLLISLTWYSMMNCAIKYQILGNQFRNIGKTNPTIEKAKIKKRKVSDEEKQKLFFEELIGLIKTHRSMQELIDRFKSCFANLFFVQITTSATCICGSIYLIVFSTLQENLLHTVNHVVLIVYNIFDIFMVMYFGNEIKLSSDRLSYCLFESNWIEQSKACKKCIIILTEFLKQPHELVIGLFYPLTLETFTSIIHLAYSMFNILQNLR